MRVCVRVFWVVGFVVFVFALCSCAFVFVSSGFALNLLCLRLLVVFVMLVFLLCSGFKYFLFPVSHNSGLPPDWETNFCSCASLPSKITWCDAEQ